MSYPIWLDYYVSFEGDWCDFIIIDDDNGVSVYRGRAYRQPNESTYVMINVRDICADYIRAGWSTYPLAYKMWEGDQSWRFIYTFRVEMWNDDASSTATIEVIPNYSYELYDDDYNLTAFPMCDTIPQGGFSPVAFPLQYRVTFYDLDGEEMFTNLYDGEEINLAVSMQQAQEDTGSIEVSCPQLGYYKKYKVIQGDCRPRYQLIYTNSVGGVDFITLEGNDKKIDNYTRHTFGQTYNNTNEGMRGSVNYQNDISRVWELHTGWVTDEVAQRMHNLFGSTDVALLDCYTDEAFSVNIRNSSCEYKTYKNQGKQLVRYDIEVELAQTLIRR